MLLLCIDHNLFGLSIIFYFLNEERYVHSGTTLQGICEGGPHSLVRLIVMTKEEGRGNESWEEEGLERSLP